ncbi:MAG: prepilin-type N-terminal cleavage/methylation domain-containing protein [Desulfococcus multivorans]|nr:prepilin-type N-terminal cleavage/methylation domain-containing protein [Desulfococcus multivorans]
MMSNRERGYTLAEVMVAIAVGMVILMAIYAAINAAQRFTAGIDRKVVAHQDTRAVLDLMAMEIQMASFNPQYSPTLWRNPDNCTGQSTNQNYKGIQTATATTLSVQSDINENGTLVANSNEIITYNYDAANQYITRESSCGGAQPFLGALPTSTAPRGVRVINTAAVPVFRYYDARGTEILPAGLPAGIPDIARIDITLWAETEEIDPSTGQRRKLIYSTSVIPRNHGIIAGFD